MSPSLRMILTRIEPVKYRDQHFGQAVTFDTEKQHIKLISQFHAPDYIHFDQIEEVSILFNRKKKLLWWGIATLFLFIGIILILIRTKVPNWTVLIKMKKNPTPVKIMVWLADQEALQLSDLLSPHVLVNFFPKK